MKFDIRKIKSFYQTDLGRYAHQVIGEPLSAMVKMDNPHGLCITSQGGYFYEDTLRQYFETLARHSADDAHDDVHNLCWPTTSATADCVVMIHDIEFSKMPENHIAEAWRVLKDTGKLIIVFPNRGGAWSARDNTPFGFGTPQTLRQMRNLLDSKRFHTIETEGVLYHPPRTPKLSFWRACIDRSAGLCGYYKPGVYMIKAIKKTDKGKAIPTLSDIAENVGRALHPKPTVNTRNNRISK